MDKMGRKHKRKYARYQARKRRSNTTIKATTDRPRLVVTRSNKHIWAQLIDDATDSVILHVDDADLSTGTKSERAYQVWERLAKLAKKQDISQIVFDRNGYLYHGRVKELAEWARSGGLAF